MQIVTRANLLNLLNLVDPDGDFATEMQVFATTILAHTQATHFVYTDHENGGDPEVSVHENSQPLVALTQSVGNGYFGMDFKSAENGTVYYCYLGGSPAQSAPGFVVSTASMVG